MTKLKTAMHVAWLAELVFSLVNFTSTAELMTCWNHPIIGMALLYFTIACSQVLPSQEGRA